MLSRQYFTKIPKLPIMQGNFMRIFNWLQLMSLKVFSTNLPNVIANPDEMAQRHRRDMSRRREQIRHLFGFEFNR